MNKLILLVFICLCLVGFSQSCDSDYNPNTSTIGECSATQTTSWAPTEPIKVWKPSELDDSERLMHEERMAFILAISKQTKRKFVSSIYHQNGTMMCYGVNTGKPNAIAHGEINAMNNCTAMYGLYSFTNMTIYNTGEPCAMCAAALVWADFATVVYGTANADLLCKVCMSNIPLDSSYIFARHYGVRARQAKIIAGVLREQVDPWFTPYCSNPNSVFYIKPRCACYNTTSPLVVSQTQTSQWFEGNAATATTQFSGTIVNNGGVVVNNPSFKSSPSGLKPKTIWGLKNEGEGDVWTLSYYPVINANGGSFSFGYIIEGTEQITFQATA